MAPPEGSSNGAGPPAVASPCRPSLISQVMSELDAAYLFCWFSWESACLPQNGHLMATSKGERHHQVTYGQVTGFLQIPPGFAR